MKTSYDPEADAFAAWFAPGVFVDFDAAGRAIGVEVLNVKPGQRELRRAM